jgi:HEPN domain-containing protein
MAGGTVEYWFEIADYDIDTARGMLKIGKYLYVGFMCHQTIEKALKGIIARDLQEGDVPPKIHNLVSLARSANLYDVMTEEQKNTVSRLNPMNIEARYPEYKKRIAEGLDAEICGKLVAETEELLCWIKEQL